MGKTVMSVLEALERYVGPYVPVILDRVFPSENKREQEKQENIDWVALAERVEALAATLEQKANALSPLPEHKNMVPLHSVIEA